MREERRRDLSFKCFLIGWKFNRHHPLFFPCQVQSGLMFGSDRPGRKLKEVRIECVSNEVIVYSLNLTCFDNKHTRHIAFITSDSRLPGEVSRVDILKANKLV